MGQTAAAHHSMKKIVIAIPHSHSWFWTQTCVASLHRYPPKAEGFETQIVVVDNSQWSPAIRGITDTRLGEGVTVWANTKTNPFHASALDDVVCHFEFDYLMALETDVVALSPEWLQWFVNLIEDGGRFAVGHWHHEQFVNPSCTIYRGDVLREMNVWCRANTSEEMRWGLDFSSSMLLNPGDLAWVAGPFAEKRGFPQGHQCVHRPSGQQKGFGWYEPGQQLFHWATDRGYPYMVCNTAHTEQSAGRPDHTLYGKDQQSASSSPLEMAQLWGRGYTAHLWGGTRALDIIKHEVSDQFVRNSTPAWLRREARFWKEAVPQDVQEQTLALIRQHRWHYRGQGTAEVTDRDRAAAAYVESIYREEGIAL